MGSLKKIITSFSIIFFHFKYIEWQKKNCQNKTLLNEAYKYKSKTFSQNHFNSIFYPRYVIYLCNFSVQWMNEDCCKFSSTIKLKKRRKTLMENFWKYSKEWKKKLKYLYSCMVEINSIFTNMGKVLNVNRSEATWKMLR